MKNKTRGDTGRLTFLAMLTALVIVLQFLGQFIRLGQFSVSLVLLPIVIGAAVCGAGGGAWLGFVFSVAVFITGDAALFLGINPIGTLITVLLKGTLAGWAAGAVYGLLKNKSRTAAVFASAVVCPVVNTGIFFAGCLVFFADALREMAGGTDLMVFIITALIGGNFIFELVVNGVLGTAVVRLLDHVPDRRPSKGEN